MIDHLFLRQLGIILIGAAVCLWVARHLGLSAILAYLTAGLVIGPWTGWVESGEATNLIAETGIVLLLFLVGLELTVDKIREVGRIALLAGLVQMVLCVSLGLAGGWVLGFRGSTLWILAFALAFSSTVVAVKMLVSQGESHTLFGQLAVGILLVQDVVVVLLLTVIGGLEGDGASGWGALTRGGLVSLGGVVGLLAGVMLAARYLLPRPMNWVARSPETLFMTSVCWCFLVVMVTHVLHLSHEIGAFVAGVSLAQMPYSHDLQRRVQPLIYFFVAVFFVTLGMGIQFSSSPWFWGQALVLSCLVIGGKLFLITLIVKALRIDFRTAFFTALLLSQISEFSLILVGVASRAGLFEAEAASLMGVVGLITISVSSLALISKEAIYEWLCRRGWTGAGGPAFETGGSGVRGEDGHVGEGEGDADASLRGHTVIIGMNTLGRELARRLTARGETVLGIDVDPRKLEELPCRTLLGDASMSPVLREAALTSARLAVSTLHIGPINDLLAYRCRLIGVPCAVHAYDMQALNHLLEMEVAYLMVPNVDGIKRQNALLGEMGLLSSSR